MSAPAAVLGDHVVATCVVHQVPSPASGAPQPAGPLPFDAPLTGGLVASVLVGGKPAAVVGSWGLATPPHLALHPADPSMAPAAQRGLVVSGAATVLLAGSPAATSASACTACAVTSASLAATATSVLVGG